MLNVITSCLRPHNLDKLLQSFDIACNLQSFNITWWVVVDRKGIEHYGNGVDPTPYLDALSLPANITLNIIEITDWQSPSGVPLQHITDGLVCWVDDDNIMHPQFLKAINYFVEQDPVIGLLYHQNLGKPPKQTNLRLRIVQPHTVVPGLIDTAQFTIHRKLIEKVKWPQRPTPKRPIYPFCPDGTFVSQVYTKHRDKFRIIKKPLCYFNYLSSPELDFS